MCDYCGTDVLPICECGREYVNTPEELTTLRAENERLREALRDSVELFDKLFEPSSYAPGVSLLCEKANEALK